MDTLRITGSGHPEPDALRLLTFLGGCAVLASLAVPAFLWAVGAPWWLMVAIPLVVLGWMLVALPSIRANAMERASVVVDLQADAAVVNSERVAWDSVSAADLTVFGDGRRTVAADLRLVCGGRRVVARLPRKPMSELREVYYHLEDRLAPYGVIPNWRNP